MSTPDTPSNAKQELNEVRDTSGAEAELRAEATRIEHDAKGARDVAKAKANAAIAEAEVAVAAKKREIVKRIDNARVDAQTSK